MRGAQFHTHIKQGKFIVMYIWNFVVLAATVHGTTKGSVPKNSRHSPNMTWLIHMSTITFPKYLLYWQCTPLAFKSSKFYFMSSKCVPIFLIRTQCAQNFVKDRLLPNILFLSYFYFVHWNAGTNRQKFHILTSYVYPILCSDI